MTQPSDEVIQKKKEKVYDSNLVHQQINLVYFGLQRADFRKNKILHYELFAQNLIILNSPLIAIFRILLRFFKNLIEKYYWKLMMINTFGSKGKAFFFRELS